MDREERLKTVLHHLITRNPHSEAVDNQMHTLVDKLNDEPDDENAVGQAPPPDGFEEVPGQPGTFRRVAT